MTPEDLAARHPRLFHVTTVGAWANIERHGLLSAVTLVDRFAADPAILHERRKCARLLTHPWHGVALLNDNLPLRRLAPERWLDPGLTERDWLDVLNARVFFWADARRGLPGLREAAMRQGRRCEVLTFDTLSLVRAHAERVELSAINSGSNIRKPVIRGHATFTPLQAHPYDAWRRLRGRFDRVLEIVVRDGVPDIALYFRGFLPDHGLAATARPRTVSRRETGGHQQ